MKKEKVDSDKTENKAAETEAAVSEKTAAVPETNVSKVGHLLKEMRLQKGLKLPDIAKKLCIRKFYLEAVEESRYEDIPAFPYGIGFIRSYADYLGLNSGNIVELYKEETNTAPDKNIFVLEPQSEATVPGKKYLLISLIGIIAVYVLWSVYNNRQQAPAGEGELSAPAYQGQVEDVNLEQLPLVVEDFSAGSETSEPENVSSDSEELPVVEAAPLAEVPAAEQITVTDASFEEPKPVAAEEPKPENGILIKVKQETWIEVKDGSKLYLSKVLKPGDTYKVPEGKGMILSAGKVDGIEVLINGVLTPVVTANKKMNISLDKFLDADNH